MKLIDPNKLLEEIKAYRDITHLTKEGQEILYIITQAIQASTKEYPYLNNTGVNIKNQNGW